MYQGQVTKGKEDMKEEWAPDRSAVKIYGDISPHPIIVTKEVVDLFSGNTEAVFHEIHRLRSSKLLPRAGSSESHPFGIKDIKYALENKTIGHRHWRFSRLQTHNEWIRGFYYIDGEHAVFESGERFHLDTLIPRPEV